MTKLFENLFTLQIFIYIIFRIYYMSELHLYILNLVAKLQKQNDSKKWSERFFDFLVPKYTFSVKTMLIRLVCNRRSITLGAPEEDLH